jgi:hypothetical protein
MERRPEGGMGWNDSEKLLFLMSLVALLIAILFAKAGHVTGCFVAFCVCDGFTASRWALSWYRRQRASASSPEH